MVLFQIPNNLSSSQVNTSIEAVVCVGSFYQSESRCHASGQILSLTMSHMVLPHSLILVLVASDVAVGTRLVAYNDSPVL